ncbi:hypothetical protein D3C84_1098390 [compost metagenome]
MASTLLLSFLMVSTVKYPNFKKIGIPKSAIWVVPLIVVVAVVLGYLFPKHLAKIIFVPLLLYALYGLKKNVRALFRRTARKNRRRAAEEAAKSEHSA